MRSPIILASAAALALAACGNDPASPNPDQAQAAQGGLEWNESLEQQLMAALDNAPSHGLTRDLFLKGDLPADAAARNRELSRIASDYASALANGKVDPSRLYDVYTVPRSKVDVAAGLAKAVDQGRLREWLDSLAPQTDEYRALGNAFVQLVKRSPDLPDDAIAPGKVIKRGVKDARVPAIARNLQALGYLPAAEQPGQARTEGMSGTLYTPAMAQAVARFQADSGRKADGVIGNDTIAALNSGPRDRARTLAVAMERLRWLERDPPATRLDVNIAGAYLDYWRDGQLQGRRKVVVGQPGWETPELGAPMFQLVANPSWTVPKSIEEKELSKKSPAYLASENIARKNGRLVQEPGPKNALGQVKFDMKDDEAIYLHDTPAKALFAEAERHESHGCVRVEGALDFARTLAEADGVLDKFEEGLASGKETFVDLRRDIPVRLMYRTAFLGTDGRIHFAEDVYGWDNAVATALGYESKPPTTIRASSEDVGP